MPPALRSGLGVPGGGARPSVFSNGDDGPVAAMKASATTCGAIIIERTKRNEKTCLPRMSVKVIARAAASPSTRANRADITPVSSEWISARSAAREVISANAAVGMNSPARVSAALINRPVGRRVSSTRQEASRMTSAQPSRKAAPTTAAGVPEGRPRLTSARIAPISLTRRCRRTASCSPFHRREHAPDRSALA